MSGRERDRRVIQALCDVGLDPETRFRFPHEFSGGQRQRIAVARAIVLEPTFVVLDEPTSALDMLIQSQMVDLLRDLQRRHHLTYLFISHDLRVVAALASRLVVMRQGKVVEAGDAAELFTESEKRLHARLVRRRVQSRSGADRRGGAVAQAERNSSSRSTALSVRRGRDRCCCMCSSSSASSGLLPPCAAVTKLRSHIVGKQRDVGRRVGGAAAGDRRTPSPSLPPPKGASVG